MTGGSLFRAAAAATAEVSARSERLDDVFGRVRRPRQAPSTCARCLPEIRVCSSSWRCALRAILGSIKVLSNSCVRVSPRRHI